MNEKKAQAVFALKPLEVKILFDHLIREEATDILEPGWYHVAGLFLYEDEYIYFISRCGEESYQLFLESGRIITMSARQEIIHEI